MRGYNRCECGNAKTPAAEACARCTWLDGTGKANLIAILRLRGFSTVGELAFELQTKTNTVTAALLRLAKRGRARKTVAYDDPSSVYYCLQDREAW
jgi:DNA-binding HxlR family transcriptional regulator